MSADIVRFPGLGLELEFSRVAFTIFGRNIYWYGLIIACGFILAVVYACKRAPQFGLNTDQIITMLIFAVPIAIICARAYYVIFYYSLYVDNPAKIFAIWEGGLAIYGGIIGAVITVLVYCKVRKIKAGALMDVGALGLLIGQGIGRWGNFANKEAHGTATDSFLRMGIVEKGQYIEVHPTFLYESVWCLLGLLVLHLYTKKAKRTYDGKVFALYVAWYGFGRFFIEGLRTDSLYIGSTGIRVSQVLAAVSFVIAIVYIFVNDRVRPRDPAQMQVNLVAAREAAAAESAEAVSEAPEEEKPAPAEEKEEDADGDSD